MDGNTAPSSEPPAGFLSFVYHVMYDPETNRRALEDLTQEMNRFDVPEDAQRLILNAQSIAAPDERLKESLVRLLADDLTT